MTEKQKRFCDYYIKTTNATQSAIAAGYSKKTAREMGAENLAKPYIRAYIDERLAQLESERIAGAEEVLRYLTSVVRGEVADEVPLFVGNGCQELVTKEVGPKDRIKAAELLGKRYGLFTDNIALSGDVGVQIVNDIPKRSTGSSD